MRGHLPFHAAVCIVAMALGPAARCIAEVASPDEEGWVPLFNGKNLDGWYSWLPSQGRNHDPMGVFKVKDGVLIFNDLPESDERRDFGYIATEKEYSHYRLRLEFKFGSKKFVPAKDWKLDSGICYHFVGPDKIWPRSLEYNLEQGGVGDFYLVDGTQITTTVRHDPAGGDPTYAPDGETYTETRPNGHVIVSRHADESGWIPVEIVVRGDEVEHYVGGRLILAGKRLTQPDPADPNKRIPLAKGRILLQVEGSDAYYRNIEIKELK